MERPEDSRLELFKEDACGDLIRGHDHDFRAQDLVKEHEREPEKEENNLKGVQGKGLSVCVRFRDGLAFATWPAFRRLRSILLCHGGNYKGKPQDLQQK